MATAGYMWPPVPPAAKATRRVLAASFWVVDICSFESFACCLTERQQRSLEDLQWKQIDQKLCVCVCVCVCACVRERERERERACLGGSARGEQEGREG